MLTRLRSHISSNLVGYLALFVALGGTSYAVSTGFIDSREIKNNTIRTGDLRNNEVRSRDIRNRTLVGRDHLSNSLGGDQIAESKLGEVPTAENALALGGTPATGFLKGLAQNQTVTLEDENAETPLLTVPGYGSFVVPTDGCEADNPQALTVEYTPVSRQDLFLAPATELGALASFFRIEANQETSVVNGLAFTLFTQLRVVLESSPQSALSVTIAAQNGGSDVGDNCRVTIGTQASG
jgi:hypothetical protein